MDFRFEPGGHANSQENADASNSNGPSKLAGCPRWWQCYTLKFLITALRCHNSPTSCLKDSCRACTVPPHERQFRTQKEDIASLQMIDNKSYGGEGEIRMQPFPLSSRDPYTSAIIGCISACYKLFQLWATVSIVSPIRLSSAKNGISGIRLAFSYQSEDSFPWRTSRLCQSFSG
jgi:hypothetical protein